MSEIGKEVPANDLSHYDGLCELPPEATGPETSELKQALPANDLSHYDGLWVAVRSGVVIAHAPDRATLHADPAVRPQDDTYPIGDPPSGFYMVNV
jgi:hypothetical protein